MKKSMLIPFLVLPLLSGCSMIGIYENADKYQVGERVINYEVKRVDINWMKGIVKLIEDPEALTFTIEESCKEDTIDELKVHSYLDENNNLSIKYGASGYMIKDLTFEKNLTITYNPLYLESINIRVESGNIEAKTISVNDARLTIVSGYIKVENMIVRDSINVQTTSGQIYINNLLSKSIRFKTISGKIEVVSANVTSSNFESTSGDISIYGFGDLKNGAFKTISGNILLSVPTNGATITAHMTSGDIITDLLHKYVDGAYIFGDGGAKIDVTTTSGNLEVK